MTANKLEVSNGILHFTEKDEVLKNFMKENFHFPSLLKLGFFTKEMRNDYKAQAERICHFFVYKTVYEYGEKEIRCHITYAGELPENEGFITVIPSLYE
jgi:acyl-CoA thioesterase FadM